MEQNQIYPNKKVQPVIVDIKSVWTAITKHRKLYYLSLALAFVVSCVISSSLPAYYTCEVLLAPESGGGGGNLSQLSSLASSFGVNISGGSSAG